MPMRITGMSSGLDIDKIVSDLMRAERIPMDKLLQKQQISLWKEDQYRSINSKLASLRDYLNTMKYSADWKSNKVTSADTAKISATADTSASAGTHTVTVASLASGASKTSSAGISNVQLIGSALSGSTTITSGSNDQLSLTLGGATKTVTLAAGTYTDAELQAQLQSAIDQTFGANKITASLNGASLQLDAVGGIGNLPQITVNTISGNSGLAALGFTDGQSSKITTNAQLGSLASKFATNLTFGDFYINGQQISYAGTDTLQDIMNRVNNSAAGVTMSYDSYSDKVSFTTKGTGTVAKVQLQDGASGNFIAAMNLDTAAVQGKDADVTIDGVQYFRSSNSITVNGVTYNLSATATNLAVTVGRDADAIFEKIKGFVDKYNETVKAIDGKRYEAKYFGYPPLTEDQKKDMKDADIKMWEDKAQSGLLRSDSILNNISRSMRSLLNTTVQNIATGYDALYEIGITTKPYDAKNPQDAGTLMIDEDQLRSAISADPDGVASLFINFPGVNPSANEKGIAYQMYDQVTAGINDLIQKAGSVGGLTDDITNELGQQVHTLQNSIDRMKVRLSSKEDYYYRQFSAMEQAIEKANSVVSWLMQIQ